MTDQERINGARLIESKIREEFSLAGKNVDSIKWNASLGGQLSNFSSHIIHVTVEGRELTLIDIPDERIQDYPARVGNEVLDAHIRELTRQ